MVEVLVKKENKLLEREEIEARVPHPGKATPSRKELAHALAEGIKVAPERLIIDKVLTHPGTTESHVKVYVYRSPEAAPAGQKARHARRLEGKKAAPAAEEKK